MLCRVQILWNAVLEGAAHPGQVLAGGLENLWPGLEGMPQVFVCRLSTTLLTRLAALRAIQPAMWSVCVCSPAL